MPNRCCGVATVEEIVEDGTNVGVVEVIRHRRLHRSSSWVDIFKDCGTVLRTILKFLDEFDLYQMDEIIYYSDNNTIHAAGPDVSGPQWAYLDQLDKSRGANKR